MCVCKEPTKNTDPRYAPAPVEGETVLFDEPGRCTGHIDYHSHHFQLVKGEFGDISLRVHHGGGEERIGEYELRKLPEVLAKLDSDSRFLVLHAFLDIHHKAERAARDKTRQEYNKAFVAGRLKKRKQRGDNFYRVWIEQDQLTGEI